MMNSGIRILQNAGSSLVAAKFPCGAATDPSLKVLPIFKRTPYELVFEIGQRAIPFGKRSIWYVKVFRHHFRAVLPIHANFVHIDIKLLPMLATNIRFMMQTTAFNLLII